MLDCLYNENDHPLPGGHHFVVLNVSINNTPVFISEIVVYKNKAQDRIPRKLRPALNG